MLLREIIAVCSEIHTKHINRIFWRSRWHPHHWLSSKGSNYQRGVLLISAGGIEGHFDRKTPQEFHQGGLVIARRNWLTWASTVLITHPILRIWPRWTTTCSLGWKKQLKGRHFSSDAEVIAVAETWLDGQPSDFLFLSGLQKLEQRAKKCIELRGECVA